VRRGAAELFAESAALFPPLFPLVGVEDALDVVASGGIPRLDELRLHQGTVWRWNRAIYDPEDGGHLRVEMRALPSGPTPLDMAASGAFLVGLTMGLRDVVEGILPALPFRTAEYEEDLKLVRDLADHFDAVMLAKAGEAYGAPEIRDLSAVLVGVNPRISIQPIIEHPKSLKIAPELMQYSTVKHVVFGIHDFSKAMGIAITPRNWTEELKFYLHDILFEARIAGKGVIGAVETLIGEAAMPEEFVEPHDVRRWLDLHGDEESRVVYRHALEEASMGLSGKQVIHPSHIHPCKVAFTPSPSEIKTKIAILRAAIEADALLGGAIKFEGEMLDPPMFGKALQTLL
jgi:citrate lyase beta subunit